MMSVSTIRVVTVDDHDLLRQGLRMAIETLPDVALIGEASNGREAVALCVQLCPDVVLMDLKMPEMDGVTATMQIHELAPDIKIIALTTFVDDKRVQAALRAGVVSYLMKNVSIAELASAIRRAYHGETTLSPEATQALVQAASQPAPQYPLTAREKQVLELLAKGYSNTEIGHALNIGASTVKKHVSSILEKMGTVSRTEAVITAIRHKLVEH
jgi:two-component system, NarL family, response regulator LiaR